MSDTASLVTFYHWDEQNDSTPVFKTAEEAIKDFVRVYKGIRNGSLIDDDADLWEDLVIRADRSGVVRIQAYQPVAKPTAELVSADVFTYLGELLDIEYGLAGEDMESSFSPQAKEKIQSAVQFVLSEYEVTGLIPSNHDYYRFTSALAGELQIVAAANVEKP